MLFRSVFLGVRHFETGWWQPHSDSPEAGAQLYGLNGFGEVFPTRLEMPNAEENRIDLIEPDATVKEAHYSQRMYTDQLKYFGECVERNQTPDPSGREGWTNMKVVDAAYESSRTGRVVEIQ